MRRKTAHTKGRPRSKGDGLKLVIRCELADNLLSALHYLFTFPSQTQDEFQTATIKLNSNVVRSKVCFLCNLPHEANEDGACDGVPLSNGDGLKLVIRC